MTKKAKEVKELFANTTDTLVGDIITAMDLATKCGGTYSGLTAKNFSDHGKGVEVNNYIYKVRRFAEAIYNRNSLETIDSHFNAIMNIFGLSEDERNAIKVATRNYVNINVGRFGQKKTEQTKNLLKALTDAEENADEATLAFIKEKKRQVAEKGAGGILENKDAKETDTWYLNFIVVSAKDISNGAKYDYLIKEGNQWKCSDNEGKTIARQLETYIYECATSANIREQYKKKITDTSSEQWQRTLKKARQAGLSDEVIALHIEQNTRKTLNQLAVDAITKATAKK